MKIDKFLERVKQSILLECSRISTRYLNNFLKKYQRFIILGTYRVGSNYLRTLLSPHSKIAMYDEVFNRQKNLLIAAKDPRDYLENVIFRIFLGKPKSAAVGFKIMYDQPRLACLPSPIPEETLRSLAEVWPILKNMKDLKVIHLKRRNMLRTFLSFEVANRSRKYLQNITENSEEAEPIALDYNALLEYFEKTSKYRIYYDEYFKGHPVIEIFYEDLVENCEKEMRKIFELLNLRYEKTHSCLKKQSTRKDSDAISNYYELKDKFRDTQWGAFFEN